MADPLLTPRAGEPREPSAYYQKSRGGWQAAACEPLRVIDAVVSADSPGMHVQYKELENLPFIARDRRRIPDRRARWRGGRRDSDWTNRRPVGFSTLTGLSPTSSGHVMTKVNAT
jgi:hypothetical protein